MLPLNSNQIPAMFQKAAALARANKPQDALVVLTQLRAIAPKRAEVPFQMAQLNAQLGDLGKASKLFEAAVKLAPTEPALWKGYVATLNQFGDDQSRKAALGLLAAVKLPAKDKKAISRALQGKQTSTSRSSGAVSKAQIDALAQGLNTGKFAQVAKEAGALLAMDRNNEVLLTISGAAQVALGDAKSAETQFRAALAKDPSYGEALAQLGQLLLLQTRRGEAREVLDAAYQVIPDNPIVLGNLGKLHTELNDPREALRYLDALLKRYPATPLGLITRAQAHLAIGDATSALADLEAHDKAIPPTGDALALRASALKLAGKNEAANLAANKALAAAPNSLSVITIGANILQQTGDFAGAEAALRSAIDRGVRSGGIYRMITLGRKFTKDDPLIGEMTALWDLETLPDETRIDLGYGLSKVMEDIGDAKQAWTYLERANALVRETHPYDRKKARKSFKNFTEFAKTFDPARIGTTGSQTDDTIFVTGLPRSGTTLVEQILASHSKITGADELGLFHPLGFDRVADTVRRGGTIKDMGDDQLVDLAQTYRAEVEKRLPEAHRITDKTISTYQIMPLVWLALPKSKIVVLRRDPRDNLWSILKNRFVTGLHLYSYSQEDLVETYAQFEAYLKEWHALASERIYELHYERLVSDPEGETRRLLAFCGLEWEDACLNFHQNKRDVKTLSTAQVRQPLYKSSVGKWEAFKDELAPMLDGLAALDDKWRV